MLGLVSVEDYNRRAAAALERAQRAAGVRSAEAFAKAIADHVGGAPAGSTYRRWVQEQQAVPGWALIAVGELTGASLDELVSERQVAGIRRAPEIESQVEDLRQLVADLQRQVADLQVKAMDRESAKPITDQREDVQARQRASGA